MCKCVNANVCACVCVCVCVCLFAIPPPRSLARGSRSTRRATCSPTPSPSRCAPAHTHSPLWACSPCSPVGVLAYTIPEQVLARTPGLLARHRPPCQHQASGCLLACTVPEPMLACTRGEPVPACTEPARPHCGAGARPHRACSPALLPRGWGRRARRGSPVGVPAYRACSPTLAPTVGVPAYSPPEQVPRGGGPDARGRAPRPRGARLLRRAVYSGLSAERGGGGGPKAAKAAKDSRP